MVFCGKPSKGCQACREKKTRCDKATPSCGQCIRAHRTCPGYRNQLDLMFRIENTTVIEKSKIREASKSRRSPKQTSPAPSVSSAKLTPPLDSSVLEDKIITHSRDHLQRGGGFTTALRLPTYTMAPSLEQQAQCFFATHSIGLNPTFNLVDTFCSQTSGDDHLLASINAVGLASFANSIHVPDLLLRARQDYILAIRLTNAALRSPAEVKKDSTLFSVMILGIFETIAGSTADSLVAWTEHINGAAALIKLRGPEQFKTEAGQRMFQQVSASLMISCIQRTIPMPTHIIELRQSIAELIEPSNPAWILSEIIVDFTIFRAAVRNLEIVGLRNIIDRAMTIEMRFLTLFKDVPDSWQYEIRYTDENPHLVFDKCYHVYRDTIASQLWNGARTCRILLHEIIDDQLRASAAAMVPIFSNEEASLQSSTSNRIMLELQADILASVPMESPNLLSQGPTAHSLTYFILWPLYLVGVMGLSTDQVRLWVIQRFRRIADEAGIRQADLMADFLEKMELLDPWEQTGLASWKPGPVVDTLNSRKLGPMMAVQEAAGIKIGGPKIC